MSRMEGLMRTMLSVAGVDMEEVKGEVLTRIATFERNVDILNTAIIDINNKQERIENNLRKFLEAEGHTYDETLTAKKENENVQPLAGRISHTAA